MFKFVRQGAGRIAAHSAKDETKNYRGFVLSRLTCRNKTLHSTKLGAMMMVPALFDGFLGVLFIVCSWRLEKVIQIVDHRSRQHHSQQPCCLYNVQSLNGHFGRFMQY
jgi:hypothetical protein